MKLRRYNQFIKESVEITDDVINILVERATLHNEILELIEAVWEGLINVNFTNSYSDMCKKKSNPESDWIEIQNYLDKKGFTLEKIKDLFSEENNKKCGYNIYDFFTGVSSEPFKKIMSVVQKQHDSDKADFIGDVFLGTSFDSMGAIQDIYFYFLFKKLGLSYKSWLGGEGWGDIHDWDSGGEYSESFIRYKYGYHQTEYGKLWMEQCKIDEKWLKKEAMGSLQNYIEDEFSSICKNISDKLLFPNSVRPGKYSKDEIKLRTDIRNLIIQNFKLEEFSIIEEDRIIIDIDKLCQEILKLNSQSEVKHSDIEAAAAEFTKEMEGFSLDMELTDTDHLIIWGTFREY
jgi:hypothetical protein